jgi:hypothetical protein
MTTNTVIQNGKVTTPEWYAQHIAQGAAAAELKGDITFSESGQDVLDVNNTAQVTNNNTRRIKITARLQSEGVNLDNTAVWVCADSAVAMGDFLYYSKEYLQDRVNIFNDSAVAERQDPKIKNLMVNYFGNDISYFSQSTLQEVITNMQSAPKGMPKFISETANFYKFENVCGSKVDLTKVTTDIVQLVKNTFDPALSPLVHPMNEGDLYIKNGNIYSLEIRQFSTKFSKFNYGFFTMAKLNPDINKKRFFAFSPLTQDQVDFVNTFDAEIVNI